MPERVTSTLGRAKEVFLDAVEVPADERAVFVAEACGGDPALVEQVQALLEAHDQVQDAHLTRIVAKYRAPLRLDLSPGDRVGGFLIREFLGEGGFGAVFRAEQEHPIRRQVALKIVKSGMDSREVVARFEAERQTMAILDHPNIARVFDAGTTELGRPYFVMEYIDGVPLTEYCEAAKLTLRERLELLHTTCLALQHAHERGVIHRDIKPNNVLVKHVDGRPTPVLIDFGIAKAARQGGPQETLATREGLMMGTPAYMSPEQAAGSPDIDTRTDVYALGVMLYELLVGEPPIHSGRAGSADLLELQRLIQEDVPSRPSVARDATRRIPGEDSRSITEADWITLKCLEKDRARRYVSPLELAADIERHFNDEPVRATPPSGLYRVRKFVRRHRISVALTTVLLLGSLIAVGGVVAGLFRARAAQAETLLQAQRADRERRTAEEVVEFLIALFEDADPDEAHTDELTVRQILDRGAGQLAEDLSGEPVVRAKLMQTIGRVYNHLAQYPAAESLLRPSLALFRQELGAEHDEAGQSADILAQVLEAQGRYGEAERLYRGALEQARASHGEIHPDVVTSLNNLAGLHRQIGDLERAEALYREALEIDAALEPGDPVGRASTIGNLSLVLYERDQLEEAEELAREALEIKRELSGDGHRDVAVLWNNLGLILFHERDYGAAKMAFEDALAIQRDVLGDAHPETANTMGNLATALKALQDFDGAERLYTESLAIRRSELGDAHPQVGIALMNLAGLLFDRGDHEGAEHLFQEAADVLREAHEGEHWMTLQARSHRGVCLAQLGRYEEAEVELREALAGLEEVLGPEHQRTAVTARRLADLRRAWGKPRLLSGRHE